MEPVIPKPGIHFDVPMETYKTWKALNPSLVKHARLSLKQFHHARSVDATDTTHSLDLGTAEHCTVLEPDEFPKRYALYKGRRAGKVYEAFEEANAGKVILKEEDYDACIAMRKAVCAHRIAGPIVADRTSIHEASIVWTDPGTGLLCKGRVDLLGNGWIADLKTVHKLTRRVVTNQIVDYGYHISMAAYFDGLRALSGKRATAKFIFVCSKAPHDVAVVPMLDQMQEVGLKNWRDLLAKVKEADEKGEYPGVAEDGELEILLPDWAVGVEDLDLDFEE